MTTKIIRTKSRPGMMTRERCEITEIVNEPEIPEFSLARARVAPGVTTELHSLDVDEWYVISAGAGMIEVDRQPATRVGPGDVIAIPSGTPQRITNTGDDDLVFDCVCLGRFSGASYRPLE